MLVKPDNFAEVLARIGKKKTRALDTETLGLRPYHGETLFSIIIAIEEEGHVNAFYFNFNPGTEGVLSDDHANSLLPLLSEPGLKWYLHNAKFDMHQLWCWKKVELQGDIFCTQALGRVEYNEHFGRGYSLDASLARIGLAKDDAVKKYVEEHGLKEKLEIPGKKDPYELHHYERVPLPIMLEYALADASGTYKLGEHLEQSILKKAAEPGGSGIFGVRENEVYLTRTVWKMEREGIRIDGPYCKRAIEYELSKFNRASSEFRTLSGCDYKASNKLFEQVFASDKDKWEYGEQTKTGQINPSFSSDVLEKFSSPIAKEVLTLRDSKSKLDFYHGFLWHADHEGIVRPNFNPGGAATGRFSSSDPNFQNLTAEPIHLCTSCGHGHDEIVLECEKCASANLEKPEFLIRRAIIPRDGFYFGGFDFKAFEYRLMFDDAKMLVDEYYRNSGLNPPPIEYYSVMRDVKESGLDVHVATGKLLGIPRGKAKTMNFLLLYGGGVDNLAQSLGVSREEAYRLKQLYFQNLPYIQMMIAIISSAAKKRKWIKNWFGRRSYFPHSEYAYKAPNSRIQGGCADIVKIGMNRIDKRLEGMRTKMLLTIHDELILEVAPGEDDLLQECADIAANVYPQNYLPMACDIFKSYRSLADWE